MADKVSRSMAQKMTRSHFLYGFTKSQMKLRMLLAGSVSRKLNSSSLLRVDMELFLSVVLLQEVVRLHLFANGVKDIDEQGDTAAGVGRVGIGGIDELVRVERIRVHLYGPGTVHTEV